MFFDFYQLGGLVCAWSRGFPSHCLSLCHDARDPLKRAFFHWRFFFVFFFYVKAIFVLGTRPKIQPRARGESGPGPKETSTKKKTRQQAQRSMRSIHTFIHASASYTVANQSPKTVNLFPAYRKPTIRKKKKAFFIYLLGTFQLIIINISLCRYNIRYILYTHI